MAVHILPFFDYEILQYSTHGVTGADGGKKKCLELAAALLSLPQKNREIIFLYFFGDYTQQEIGEMYGRCRSTTGYLIRRTLQLLHKEMEVLSHGESEPFAL